ncbi:transglycosylase-like protein with SLT domain [Alicyclobacillus sacchari]|uniref:Transglycosylase-like protein with SLT domain n=1 Tax=Alicyclobacillus sacchari TaxID=392010 RepID=A0A4R8LP18_9BACL|nr:lytic transglycosylase domain-containing protein [Alicyclobacillus sacchari]TDY48027.1 transglycosylase-like protein with SLT domain [Alicyclobacillus sacchari]GMA56163.1 hypothetical protein GCM10025858_06660 [Alicyclobacillus sacchari]
MDNSISQNSKLISVNGAYGPSNSGTANTSAATAAFALLLEAEWMELLSNEALPDVNPTASGDSIFGADTMFPADSSVLLSALPNYTGTVMGNLETADAVEAPADSQIAPPSATNSSGDVSSLVEQAANAYGVPAALVQAVIAQESGGNANAVSDAGAIGLMQLMPATAAALGVNNPYDPAQNIDGGTRYLAQLMQEFGGSVPLALAAYNAGPNAVKAYGGIPPYPETQQYVQSILAKSGLTQST